MYSIFPFELLEIFFNETNFLTQIRFRISSKRLLRLKLTNLYDIPKLFLDKLTDKILLNYPGTHVSVFRYAQLL